MNTIKPKKQIEEKELENNKKIKPMLAKFVIDTQRQNAEAVAKERKAQDDLLLGKDDVIRRAAQLATIALLKTRVWEKIPPYLSMEWTRHVSGDPMYTQEMHQDIAGFATYLAREYNNYIKGQTLKKGYPNPMQEENLTWFWSKFNNDLRLLIEAEKRRVAAGNKSLIIDVRKQSPGIILPNGQVLKN